MNKYVSLCFILFLFSIRINAQDSTINNTRIFELEKNISNLQTELSIREKSFDPETYMESVNQYYENAWSKLIYVFGGIGAIIGLLIGVLVPYLVKKDQDRKYKLELDALLNKIDAKISKEIQEASVYISSDQMMKLSKIQSSIQEYVDKKMHEMSR